jgi:hypothetical protein
LTTAAVRGNNEEQVSQKANPSLRRNHRGSRGSLTTNSELSGVTMKNNKIMQAAPGEPNPSATAAGAEGVVVRDHDDSLSEGQLESIVGGDPHWVMLDA